MISLFNDERFIVAICFIILIYIIYRPAKKAIVRSLDDRINEIKNKVAETHELKHDAQLLLEKITQEIQIFEEKKKVILKQASTNTQEMIKIKAQEMKLVLDQQKNLAIECIENQKKKAYKQIHIKFTKSVVKIVKTYLRETKNSFVSNQEINSHLFKDYIKNKNNTENQCLSK